MGRGSDTTQAISWAQLGARGQGNRGKFILAQEPPSRAAIAMIERMIAKAAVGNWRPAAEVLQRYGLVIRERPLLERLASTVSISLSRAVQDQQHQTVDLLAHSLGLVPSESAEVLSDGHKLHLFAAGENFPNLSYLRDALGEAAITCACGQRLLVGEIHGVKCDAWARQSVKRCQRCQAYAGDYPTTTLTAPLSPWQDSDLSPAIDRAIDNKLHQAWIEQLPTEQLPVLAREAAATVISDRFATTALADPELAVRRIYDRPKEWDEVLDALASNLDVSRAVVDAAMDFSILTHKDWSDLARQYLLPYDDDQEPVAPQSRYVSESVFDYLCDRLKSRLPTT